jgi:hypothetical protein
MAHFLAATDMGIAAMLSPTSALHELFILFMFSGGAASTTGAPGAAGAYDCAYRRGSQPMSGTAIGRANAVADARLLARNSDRFAADLIQLANAAAGDASLTPLKLWELAGRYRPTTKINGESIPADHYGAYEAVAAAALEVVYQRDRSQFAELVLRQYREGGGADRAQLNRVCKEFVRAHVGKPA